MKELGTVGVREKRALWLEFQREVKKSLNVAVAFGIVDYRMLEHKTKKLNKKL